ncbi:MAG: methylated-DNA--[protein]-cysteine S-methyltransferase [Pseudomonadota bacterium]
MGQAHQQDAAASMDSPFGRITISERDGAITAVNWGGAGTDDTPLLAEAKRQLEAYCQGTLQVFDLPLAPAGGQLQQQVCAAMSAIPFGQTREYGEMARDLGVPPQAIGQACGGNSIPIIIPCHRVVGATGLGGFSARGGVETKIALLRHEGAYSLLI